MTSIKLEKQVGADKVFTQKSWYLQEILKKRAPYSQDIMFFLNKLIQLANWQYIYIKRVEHNIFTDLISP